MKARSSRKPADAEERAFLQSYDPAAYPHPSVAVDVAVVTVEAGALRTLLVQRSEHPGKGAWALPGGFVGLRESLDDAATRVLADKARLRGVYLEQLFTFGAPERDPRTRVISVAYYALVECDRLPRTGAGPVVAQLRVPWPEERGGPVEALDDEGRPLALAFDHAEILGTAVKRMRGKLDYAPIGFQMLGPTFTLLQLQRVHEAVSGRPQNKDSFRRRMLASGLLAATGKMQAGVEHRPAELFRFVRRSAV